MKNKPRKKYTTEFKQEAVGLVLDQGYTKAEAGRSLGVNPNLIRRWQLEFESAGVNAFPGQGKLTPDQQRIKELEEALLAILAIIDDLIELDSDDESE